MAIKIYCKPTAKGVHSFYLVDGQNEYYLFSQAYRKGVAAYYRDGVLIDKATQHSKARGDTAVLRTMDKLPVYIRYLEKEQGIKVLRR